MFVIISSPPLPPSNPNSENKTLHFSVRSRYLIDPRQPQLNVYKKFSPCYLRPSSTEQILISELNERRDAQTSRPNTKANASCHKHCHVSRPDICCLLSSTWPSPFVIYKPRFWKWKISLHSSTWNWVFRWFSRRQASVQDYTWLRSENRNFYGAFLADYVQERWHITRFLIPRDIQIEQIEPFQI